MAFRQALQLAACGLAGGSAAVLLSAVAVGKPRGGGDAGTRAPEPPAWTESAQPGPSLWDSNWDRCATRPGEGGRALRPRGLPWRAPESPCDGQPGLRALGIRVRRHLFLGSQREDTRARGKSGQRLFAAWPLSRRCPHVDMKLVK